MGCSSSSNAGSGASARAKCSRVRRAGEASPVFCFSASAGMPHSAASALTCAATSRRNRIDLQRKGHRQVLLDGRRFDQHRRGLTMPKRSREASQSSPVVIAAVSRPMHADGALRPAMPRQSPG